MKTSKPQKSKISTRSPRATKLAKVPSKDSAIAKKSSSKKAKGNVHEDQLLEAIRALGGGTDDYELVKDLESDDTQEFSDRETNAKTTRDIAHFLKKLNFKEHEAVFEEEEGEDLIVEVKEPLKKQNKTKVEATFQAVRSSPRPEETTSAKKQLAAAKLNIPASARWYAVDLPPLRPTPNLEAPMQSELSSVCKRAEELHSALPPPPSTSKSDEQFIANVLASGTLSDRLSALTLLAQSSPIHNTRALESLRTMAGKKGREVSLKALRAIVDWWVGGGGPDRKLKYLADQPVNHPDLTDAQLTVWYFEDWLKKYFFNILQLLEGLSLDPLPYVRMQATTLIFQLLDGKPEQEQNLLRLLVNKLGDSEKPVASKASYELLRLLQHHPGMKGIITREISSLIFRPVKSTASGSKTTSSDGVNLHARYYSVITLNQIMLSSGPEDQAVADLLVDLYFKLFREILHESARSEDTAKHAVTNDDGEGSAGKGKGKDYVDEPTKRDSARLPKGNPKGKAPEAATGAGFTEVEDSDSKTISAILSGVNRAMPFASTGGLLFESHIDTLFRITHTATFNVSVQAMMLILQVTSSKRNVSDRFYRALYESIIDSRLINSSKQAMWLNLAFKAINADVSFNRTCAFVKRILQSLDMHQPPFICGTLYMMGQLMETKAGLRDLIHTPHPVAQPTNTHSEKPSRDTHLSPEESYDSRKRDPQYAHAETTCLWELIPLLHHFHPSVSLHAQQLLTSAHVTATPDLALNTVSHFLDRFVYKNPKKPKPRGASAMQPAASKMSGAGGAVRLIRGAISGPGDTMNEESFWKKPAEDIPVDQLFFHRFFMNKLENQKEKNRKLAKRRKGEDGSDNDPMHDGESDSDADEVQGASNASEKGGPDANSEEDETEDDRDEDEIWRIMQQTMPGPKADLDLMGGSESDDIPYGLDDDDLSDLKGNDAKLPRTPSEPSDDDAIEPAELDEYTSDAGVQFPEDDEDIVGSDEEVLIPSAFEPEDLEAVGGKRKPSEEGTQRAGRKKRKIGALPTFGSYEDYAKLIEEAPEENL